MIKILKLLIILSCLSVHEIYAQHMSVFSMEMGCSISSFVDYLINYKGFYVDNSLDHKTLKGQFMGEECEIENMQGERNCDLIIISVPFWAATSQAQSHMESWLDMLFTNYNKKYNPMSNLANEEFLALGNHFTSQSSHNILNFAFGWSCNYGYVYVLGMQDPDFDVSFDIKICYIDEASRRMNQNRNNGYTDY